MSEPRFTLPVIDRIEVTTLCDNVVDLTAPDVGPAKRLKTDKADPYLSSLLSGPLYRGFVAEHGLSMHLTATVGERSRSLLFDTGGSPDGLVNNLDRLEIDARGFGAIALSHGHWDHVVGLVGLLERLGRQNMPLVLHPEAFL
ncbi:MAG: MBL fold metallo-hydrolase, partial [Chloroflexi bacterium]|nr:MBL fold metallo-hydrolase [Chloroflexota bacterium]